MQPRRHLERPDRRLETTVTPDFHLDMAKVASLPFEDPLKIYTDVDGDRQTHVLQYNSGTPVDS